MLRHVVLLGSNAVRANWEARRAGRAIARVHGKGPRCVVLPTMRPVPGTWRRWQGERRRGACATWGCRPARLARRQLAGHGRGQLARSSEHALQRRPNGVIMSRAYAANAKGGMVRMAWPARGDGALKVVKLRQLVEELLLGAQPFLGPGLHEGRVPQRRAEDNYASLGVGLVGSPHLIAQFRDPRRSGAC